MYPFIFGNSDSQLYGVYHSTQTGFGSSTKAVLLCQPIMHEYMRSHWSMRQLAHKLSARGIHCLRFDYYGTGDSSGVSDDGTLARWQEDIHLAKEELESLSGAKEIVVVGLRIGASLAIKAAENGLGFDKIVLWDPVLSGKDYISTLQRLHRSKIKQFSKDPAVSATGSKAQFDELLGYPFPNNLREEMNEVDLLTTIDIGQPKVLMVVTEMTSIHEALREHLLSLNNEVKLLQALESPGNWSVIDEVGEALLSRQAIQMISDEIV